MVAGCGLIPEGSQPSPPACPSVAVLEGAGVTAGYRPGDERNPRSLRYMAGLSEPVSSCRYRSDGLEVDLSFNVLAEKGPAFNGGPLELTYFVAVVGPDQQVRSKELFSTELTFADGRKVAGQAESLTLRYPFVFAGEGVTLSFFLGFQLDPAETRRRMQRLLP